MLEISENFCVWWIIVCVDFKIEWVKVIVFQEIYVEDV